MSLFKIFWNAWLKNSFVKSFMFISIFTLLFFNIFVITTEKDLFYSLGGSFKIPQVLNLFFAINFHFVYLIPILLTYIAGINDHNGSFLRYIYLSGYGKDKIFYFFQKSIIFMSLILTFIILLVSLIVGFKEGFSPAGIHLQDLIWPIIFFIQSFAIGNFLFLILLLSRSVLKTILITVFLSFILEPILYYIAKDYFDYFSYFPFRTINNLSYVQGMTFTISASPDRGLNLIFALIYLIVCYFINLNLFRKINI